jgi:FkbM family methyltransferase
LLKSHGVNVVLDVGANAGQYALQLRRGGYRNQIISFEPVAEAFAELVDLAEDDPAWECRRLALGETDGSIEINVSANLQSSSILEMEKRHHDSAPESAYLYTEEVPIARLDDIWPGLRHPQSRPYLKLDVQGYELSVLKGGETSLSDMVGIQVELSLVPLYQGGPLFREMLDYFESHDFRLAGLEPGFEDPATGEMLQADGIFLRAE